MKGRINIKKKSVLKLCMVLIVVIAVYLVFQLTPFSISDFTPERMKSFIQQFGIISPLVFIIIYSLRAVILVLPVGIMSLSGGLAFGKWWGTIFILLGATLGSCFSFLIARYLGREFIENRAWLKKGRIKSFDQSTEKHGFRVILFMRLVPLFQYDAVNFGAGLSRMKFRDYVMGSFLGMAPGGFISALLGSSLDNIMSVQFFVALGIFILLMFIPSIYKTIIRKKEKLVKRRVKKTIIGECPGCREKIDLRAIILAWDNWGRFICQGCRKIIRFQLWFLTVIVLMALLIAVERLLHFLLVIDFPLWLSFIITFIISILVISIVPVLWRYKIEE
jgi:uncharacterized membrane protein YdjX (TVP38/TMEM64 family)